MFILVSNIIFIFVWILYKMSSSNTKETYMSSSKSNSENSIDMRQVNKKRNSFNQIGSN